MRKTVNINHLIFLDFRKIIVCGHGAAVKSGRFFPYPRFSAILTGKTENGSKDDNQRVCRNVS